MKILNHTKKAAYFLSLSLFTVQALPFNGCRNTAVVSAQAAFQNVHELYSYWCQNEYADYPDNVGEVYCYYYDSSDMEDFEDVVISAAVEEYAGTSSHAAGTVSDEEDVSGQTAKAGEVAADQNSYAYVIGLVKDTPEEEEKILSLLEDKSHVKFTSCNYSHKELTAALTEITNGMMAAENKEEDVDKTYRGICGAGITCSDVKEDGNGGFTPMRCYLDVLVLSGYYDDTAKLLTQKYGDKVQVSEGAVTTVEDDMVDTGIDDTAMTDGIDIGGTVTADEAEIVPAIGAEIAETEEEKTSAGSAGFLRATTALTVGDTFTFACGQSGKKAVKWSVTPSKKAAVVSIKEDTAKNASRLKIKAKKTGYAAITAKIAGKKKITQKVLILDKKGTVSNQKQLTAALNSDKVKKITIKTSGEKSFTIPAGSGGTKKIIVNAPKSDLTVEEPSLIASITIEKIKQFKETETNAQEASADTAQAEEGSGSPEVIQENDSASDIHTFYGTIAEINGVTGVVEPDEASAICRSGDRVSVKLAVSTTDNFSVGDRVKVTYEGGVMETYPLQINTVMVEKVPTGETA